MKVPVIYLRIPPVLKRDVQKAADKSGLSVNQWVQRCLERVVAAIDVDGP